MTQPNATAGIWDRPGLLDRLMILRDQYGQNADHMAVLLTAEFGLSFTKGSVLAKLSRLRAQGSVRSHSALHQREDRPVSLPRVGASYAYAAGILLRDGSPVEKDRTFDSISLPSSTNPPDRSEGVGIEGVSRG